MASHTYKMLGVRVSSSYHDTETQGIMLIWTNIGYNVLCVY